MVVTAELLVGSGYEKFGIITGPTEKLEANLRLNGFQDFLRKNNNLKLIGNFKVIILLNLEKWLLKNSIKNKNKNLGIFSSNDQMALGFLHSAFEKGFKTPGHYGIVIDDNMPYSKVFFTQKLSTIDTDLDLLAKSTLDFIIQKIKNSNEGTINPTTTLPVELIKRRTHL